MDKQTLSVSLSHFLYMSLYIRRVCILLTERRQLINSSFRVVVVVLIWNNCIDVLSPVYGIVIVLVVVVVVVVVAVVVVVVVVVE